MIVYLIDMFDIRIKGSIYSASVACCMKCEREAVITYSSN